MTQKLIILSRYIGNNFFHVGLNLCLYFTGNVATRGASDQTREKARVDLVDFGPPDLDERHVTNWQPSI